MSAAFESRYDAYGDESIGPEIVTYATVLIPEDKATAVSAIIDATKAVHGKPGERLHSRILFSGDQRKKSAWAHLSMADVFALYEALFTALDKLGLRKIVTFAIKKDFPDELPSGPWQSADPNLVGPMPWMNGHSFSDKHIASFCARGTMIPLSKWPGLERVRFWPDPDSTLIEWSNGRRQFSGSVGGFINVGPGRNGQIEVMSIQGSKPPFLEIADAMAYVAQRSQGAGHSNPNERRFKSLHRQIHPEIVRFQVGPDGGFILNVPNDSLDYRPKNNCPAVDR
jgi:hypothetical protein